MAALSMVLVGCGERVDVPPALVAKIVTKDGYKEGIIPTSKFRLDPCMAYCDKLVLLDASDKSVGESIEIFMPKDKLNMKIDLKMTLSVSPAKYEEVFKNVAPASSSEKDSPIYYIPWETVYSTYAKQILISEAREYLSQYSIGEISSNLERVNQELSAQLSKSIASRTPFVARFVGLANPRYPDIIVKAQENAAERRERIEQENAQLEISRVELERKLQEANLKRKVEVTKAQADAEVAAIQSKAMTPEYRAYRQLEVLEKMADSDNKVFIPVGMLDGLAVQSMIGK
ncbi:hypothetical protein FDI24_gp211 [Acidovorax phage ACP17]|uniref:Band 7 domain-containing protein n=1 Tax=Acidovorax phage ACP17 TaxID=2010329 RepID=A0A218M363_9CAUD|nr:hypothetical protein FDI24_gp211 [Acidovorax phage ACP17]ASD50492.1 hypothetical protein [Acidovorax phage ACP17]